MKSSTKTDLSAFASFAPKGTKAAKVVTNNCVIYTRVSTKEQAENNLSLETQKRYCEDYANRKGLVIIQYFGGTYESAKNDERKEFKRMLDFVTKSAKGSNPISHVIVYSTDRFSRSGANAIGIADQLRRKGITITAVTQPADTTTAAGTLQQNIQFAFSEFDNQQRREKTVVGIIERLRMGYWVTKVPQGYDQAMRGREQVITINKEGEKLRQAFELKAQGLSNEQIATRMRRLGLYVTGKRLSTIFRNVFYCGLIRHELLGDELIEGRHPALVDRDTFLAANEMLKLKRPEYKVTPEEEALPLRRFLQCACGSSMSGYEVKKKRLHYYKCSRVGCKTNKSAKFMHEAFEKLLEQYELNPFMLAPLRVAIEEVIYEQAQHERESRKPLLDRLADLSKKVEAIEERFVLGEITREQHEKFGQKYAKEITEIRRQLAEDPTDLSNLSRHIEKSLLAVSKLRFLWQNSTGHDRRQLQEILFPAGLVYDKEWSSYRTTEVNPILSLTASISSTFRQQKNGMRPEKSVHSALVASPGIEGIYLPLPNNPISSL